LNESKQSQDEINRIEGMLRAKESYKTLEKLYDES